MATKTPHATLVKTLAFLGLVPILSLQVGCGDDNDSSESGLAFTESSFSIEAELLEGLNPLEVTFHATVEDADVLSANWDFGDGNFIQTSDGTVTHTYTQSGKFTGRVQLNTNSRDVFNRTIDAALPEIDVFPDVNLVVSSFAIDREVTPGGGETVSAIIQNIGTDTLGGGGGFLHVGYYLSVDNVITVDDIYIGDTSIVIGDFFTAGDVPFGAEQLSAGENYQYDHQLAVKGNVPAGTYFAGAIVDYIDEYHWYVFPRATDTKEYVFPTHIVVPESNELDNVRVLDAYKVVVNGESCTADAYEDDDDSSSATVIQLGEAQPHNFCQDNSDWLKFDATEGNIYKITTSSLGTETDTQLILYDADGASILLFHDNMGTTPTVDLESGFPPDPASEIVWEAQRSDTYFIKVRTTTCDEDEDEFCGDSPDGVGVNTEYTITLQ